MEKLKSKALIINPKKSIFFKDIIIERNSDSEVKTEWTVSSVCNSERRRFNLTKSHTDPDSFVGGHEAVGVIESEFYIKRHYALLPHSNCMTRNDDLKCPACLEGRENLCSSMKHAGLDKNTPSGFTNQMFVPKSQLYDVSEIDLDIAPFLEPLSCVVRSWRLAKFDILKDENIINIIGGGPIGCLHALYLNKLNNSNKINIVEKDFERFDTLKKVFSDIKNIKISNEDFTTLSDVSVMAASNSSAYSDTVKLTKPGGKVILFSGFDDLTLTDNNFLPEVIHRNEFTHYSSNIVFVGSSGYTKIDLSIAKSHLLNFGELKKLVTGKVFGLCSKTIILADGTSETYDEPVLIKDLKGHFQSHIKIQYFNNQNTPNLDI